MDILFNMVVSKKEFSTIESIADFVDVVERNLKPIVDIEGSSLIEILFVEKVDSEFSFIIHSKDKSSLDLDDKQLLVFLIRN